MRLSYLVVLAIGLAAGFVVGFSIRPTPPAAPPGREPLSRDDGGKTAPTVAPEHPGSREEKRPEGTPPGSGRETVVLPPESSPRSRSDLLAAAVREHLAAAGIRSRVDLGERISKAIFRSAAWMEKDEPFATGRRAARREAEVMLEREIRALLDSEQIRALDEHLDGKTLVEALPGGKDDDTHSSTGVAAEKVESMVLETYRRRIRLPADPHPGILDAVSRYVAAVRRYTDALIASRGHGFVEAVCSGPTPHTEEARFARDAEDYAPAALEVRAGLWRLQADFERSIVPWLDEAQRKRLAEARPTALRFLVSER